MTTAAARSRMSGHVLILALAPAQLLDVAGPAEVFAQAGRIAAMAAGGSGQAGSFTPLYTVELALAAADGAAAAVPTSAGIALACGRPLAELLADERPLDTLLICGGEGARTRCAEAAVAPAVRTLASRAQRVASVCTGAFILAAAGLLDGRRATTHWRWCDRLARDYPAVRVEPEPIFVEDRNLWTSAGITAGMDMTLAMVEADHGHALALAIARELVMFLRRPGDQGQFSATLKAQSVSRGSMRDLIAWMAENLHRRLGVDDLAARAGFSPRQFARVFQRECGAPPGRMVDLMRIEAARRRLENAEQGLSSIAAACGFGGEEAMRRAFLRHLGTPPGAYRERFRSRAAETTLPH